MEKEFKNNIKMKETSEFETQPLDEELKITYDECLILAKDIGSHMPVIDTIFKLYELRGLIVRQGVLLKDLKHFW